MKVLAPIKRVPDPYAKPRPLPDGSALDTTGLKFEINPFDEIALEAAVRLREGGAALEIVAVALGPSQAEEQLRKALAMGADEAVLIETDATYDALGVARELEAVARARSVELVLMGKQATDDDANQVAQMLAAFLGWPQATFASAIELRDGGVEVVRETDAGEERLKLPFPCVISADLRLAEPRYIALPGIIKARSKPLDRVTPSRPAEPRSRIVSLAPAPERPAGRKVGSVDELIEAMRARGAVA